MSKDVNVGKKTDVTYLRRLRPNDVTLTFVGFLYASWWVFLSKLHQLLDTLIIRRCIICTTIMQQFFKFTCTNKGWWYKVSWWERGWSI